jgi:hypothetical protein
MHREQGDAMKLIDIAKAFATDEQCLDYLERMLAGSFHRLSVKTSSGI